MKWITFSLLLSLTVFTLSSCKKSNPVSSSSGQQILPLKIGNTWLMQYTFYDTAGTAIETIYDTAAVTMDTVVSGDMWYYISTITSSGPIFCANKSDGLWENTLGSSIAPSLVYKYPANVGDIWDVNLPSEGDTINQVSLQSNSVSVTVPKGTYTCYEYRMLANSQPAAEVYFYPGLGYVAIDIYSNTNSGRVYKKAHGELTSVTLK